MKKNVILLMAAFLSSGLSPVGCGGAAASCRAAAASRAGGPGGGKDAWFVDGYHGGIYGHYPVGWYTRFIVDRLAGNPDWRICLEIEPETWDTVRLRTPADYAAFSRVAAGDRVEFTNPTYAQPYLYNIGGESVIRQFAYGIGKLRSHFPDARMVTYAAEEPCFTSCLPQVLRGFGFRYASLKCPDTCWGGYTSAYGGELVNWVSPDGTSLLAVPRYACEELKEGTTWQTIAWDNSPYYIDKCLGSGIRRPVGMCFQDAGWKNGPWLGRGGEAARRSTYTLWTDYIERVTPCRSSDDYRFTQEDVRPGLMWGTQVMQRIARSVRRTENAMSQTEKVAAMARLCQGFRPDQAAFDEAWRTLMLSQHHDSWIVPYNRLNERGTWADNIRLWTAASDSLAAGVMDAALESFGDGGGGSAPRGVRLFNTLGATRREIVTAELPTGRRITFEAVVPPFGYATYDLARLETARPENGVSVAADSCVVENDTYRVVFDLSRGGAISSLVDKTGGGEYVAVCDSMPFNGLRGWFPDEGGFRSSAAHRATATVISDNSLVKSVRVSGEVAGVPFVQTVTLRRGQRLIDCALEVGWAENRQVGDIRHRDKGDKTAPYYDTRRMLNLLFPAATGPSRVFKDAPFDVCESRLDDTFYNRWDSIKHNVVLSWVDVAGMSGRSIALLTDHTTSYSHGAGHPLALTVQYSGPGLWWRDYPVTAPTRMRYALVPHRGRWDEAAIDTECRRWNEPLVAQFADVPGGDSRSLVDLDGTGYEVSACVADSSGVTLRLFNSSGCSGKRKVRLGFRAGGVEETDLLGHTLRVVDVRRSSFTVDMPRFGFRTFKIKL